VVNSDSDYAYEAHLVDCWHDENSALFYRLGHFFFEYNRIESAAEILIMDLIEVPEAKRPTFRRSFFRRSSLAGSADRLTPMVEHIEVLDGARLMTAEPMGVLSNWEERLNASPDHVYHYGIKSTHNEGGLHLVVGVGCTRHQSWDNHTAGGWSPTVADSQFWGELVAATGEFSCPSVGRNLAATGEDLMSADIKANRLTQR